jgi:hypothetical protein
MKAPQLSEWFLGLAVRSSRQNRTQSGGDRLGTTTHAAETRESHRQGSRAYAVSSETC